MGKNRYVRFEASMNQRGAAPRHRTGAPSWRWRRAVDALPAPDFGRRCVFGGRRSLLRWNHAELGNVSPMEAISVAKTAA
jgi:hypothetical protein